MMRELDPDVVASWAVVTAVDAVKVFGSGDTVVRALDGVNLEIASGKLTAIMGPSGSGKSTLLHCMAGLDRLTSGEVTLGGTSLSALSEDELTRLRRDSIGFIFQFFNLIPTLTAAENIRLPLALAKRSADEAWFTAVVDVLHIGDRLKHLPPQLSGGQQQRVAAARALVSKPSIIFADEPTGNLDSRAGVELLDFLRTAVDEFGQTIVMVTHDAVAASRSDRVVFLADGKIVDEIFHPTTDGILDRMKELRS